MGELLVSGRVVGVNIKKYLKPPPRDFIQETVFVSLNQFNISFHNHGNQWHNIGPKPKGIAFLESYNHGGVFDVSFLNMRFFSP